MSSGSGRLRCTVSFGSGVVMPAACPIRPRAASRAPGGPAAGVHIRRSVSRPGRRGGGRRETGATAGAPAATLPGEVGAVGGEREGVARRDGTPIGLLTAGSGPPLLLVHGGLSGRSRFAPLWTQLAGRYRVSALDRRGSSGDAAEYDLVREHENVAAVAGHLAARAGRWTSSRTASVASSSWARPA